MSSHICATHRAKLKKKKHEGFSHIQNLRLHTAHSTRSVLHKLAQHIAQAGSLRTTAIVLEPFIYFLSRSVFLKAAIAIAKGLRENSHFH